MPVLGTLPIVLQLLCLRQEFLAIYVSEVQEGTIVIFQQIEQEITHQIAEGARMIWNLLR